MPRLSAFGDRVVLSWIEPAAAGGALRFASWENGRWSEAKTAAASPRLAVDGSDIPGVAPLAGGGLAAYWSVRSGDAATAPRELAVAISKDGGTTWSAPVRPHRDRGRAAHGMATLLARAEPGRFGLAWLDGRAGEESEYGAGGTALYWADWNGTAFGPEVVLDAYVCDCCKTSGAMTAAGPLLAYRDREEHERRDTSVVREEGGKWLSPASVHVDGWTLRACPTNGPAVATSGERAAVVWFTGANAQPAAFVVHSADAGKTFGPPVRVDGGSPSGRVDVAVFADGSAAVVWLEKTGGAGEVRARLVPPSGAPAAPIVLGPTSAARASGNPRILAIGDREALVAWTETGPPVKLRASVVSFR